MPKISLEETLQYAKEAKDYAREHIKKGSTQIENNDLQRSYNKALNKGIDETRAAAIKKMEGNLLEPFLIAYYENEISTSSKYSLGNCQEYSFQAFDYILNHPNIDLNAEICNIKDGDHGFLVINRNPDSDLSDPNSWGESAVICDPWANKVYKASDYLSELEIYYEELLSGKNRTEPFDPSTHTIISTSNLNTSYFRRERTIDRLKSNFIEKSIDLIKILENYRDELTVERQRLEKKYGDQDEKVVIILNRINKINQSIIEIEKEFTSALANEYPTDYRVARLDFIEWMRLLNKNAVHAMQFTQEEQSKLFEHKGQDTKTEIMKFFGVKTKTQSHLRSFVKEVNEQSGKKRK